VRFGGTELGIEARVLPELGWELTFLKVSGLQTVGFLGMVRGLLKLPGALWQARRAVKDFHPDVVVGVGGYASGPVVLMARLIGVPTAICEQNSVPGFTNKVLGKVARRAFLSFEMSRRYFDPKKVVMSGNPVRRELTARLLAAAATTRPDDAPVTVLVSGGSQGAKAVNELASAALIELSRERQGALTIIHQTGKADLEATEARYAGNGVTADCRAFIRDMAEVYQRADLIVGRAGATTVAELAIAGKPAVFIPFPTAADNHQELNAREMAEAGAALMFRQADLTAEKLAAALRPLLDDADARARMGEAMRKLAKPDAAAAVIDWCATAQYQ
jgi:UDP-N-acetylglucosamine--N-acetylmuramyl-(pentapeptide) pyrophosphoryl-undecaprenol N-acetylglucosamine transferase